ncbi:cytochrome P450 4C1-like [Macrosteles quadrilineatus]|uniref:cytochrome P450 4C1-like n=1 Tax=Macrosteles quadrilineatus TaxID=74068 RepID=UPI0023E1B1D5|nr:cytochrome P450 4C1-like [Macrosteles quadrilineatus]
MIVSELFVSCVILVVAVVFFVKKSVQRYKFKKSVNKFPGPPTIPVLGNVMDLLVPRNELMKVFRSRTENYGPIFRVWNGPIAEVHLTRPEHLELIMSSSMHIDKSNVYTLLQPWLGTGLLTGTGAKWHSHRKLITPTFHFKILDIFLEVFVEKSSILVEKLQKAPKDTPMDLYPFITHCALDIICETAMGVSINAQDGNKSDYVSAIYEISELTIHRLLRPWYHPNFSFYMSSYGKRYKKCLDILHGFTNKVIKERQITRALKMQDPGASICEEENDIGTKKSMAFLDLLLEASEQGSKLNTSEIREEVDTFMFEGHDTTTAGICWSLFLLGSHPEHQEKVLEELDSIFGDSDRGATTRDLNEMKYLERVIKEALRLFPSVPFIGRKVTQDTQLGDYVLPAGSVLNLEIFHVHRCPDQWGPEPEKFNPDNFLPDRVKSRHPYAYVPFSAGPRNCIGKFS